MREYRNFKEIERDLQLLKLQKEIDKEKILLNYHQTKESISPKRLVKSAAGSIFKNALILKVATKFLGFIGDKWK
jgi:UDP-N-acetylenolpyruvoylglucosamine reductase